MSSKDRPHLTSVAGESVVAHADARVAVANAAGGALDMRVRRPVGGGLVEPRGPLMQMKARQGKARGRRAARESCCTVLFVSYSSLPLVLCLKKIKPPTNKQQANLAVVVTTQTAVVVESGTANNSRPKGSA